MWFYLMNYLLRKITYWSIFVLYLTTFPNTKIIYYVRFSKRAFSWIIVRFDLIVVVRITFIFEKIYFSAKLYYTYLSIGTITFGNLFIFF